MDLKVEITPEQINAELTRAVMDSFIGKAIADAIQSHLHDYKFRQHIEGIIQRAISDQVDTLIKTEFGPAIEAKTRERMTDEFINEAFTKMWNSWSNRY